MPTRLLCNFETVPEESNADVLVIRDIGPHSTFKTVTNDVENVIAFLTENGQLNDGRQLLYYDSDGDRDELLHKGGKFVGFRPLAARHRR